MSLMLGQREMALHTSLLKIFNPDNQLNPGKVFPNRSFVGCCAPTPKVAET
jgi:hypothetical protein